MSQVHYRLLAIQSVFRTNLGSMSRGVWISLWIGMTSNGPEQYSSTHVLMPKSLITHSRPFFPTAVHWNIWYWVGKLKLVLEVAVVTYTRNIGDLVQPGYQNLTITTLEALLLPLIMSVSWCLILIKVALNDGFTSQFVSKNGKKLTFMTWITNTWSRNSENDRFSISSCLSITNCLVESIIISALQRLQNYHEEVSATIRLYDSSRS